MKSRTQPAEVFHPGSFIREEIQARGWSVETLIEKSLLRRDTVEELLAEHGSITPVIALCLASAFGMESTVWLNLQKSWAEFRQGQPGQ